MNVLIIHQNFPGQFRHIASALAKKGHLVVALAATPRVPDRWEGVRVIGYKMHEANRPKGHPWLSELQDKVVYGESVLRAAIQLKRSGFNPDVVIAHPGWGETLFIKGVWPKAKLGIHCEFFFQSENQMFSFDPEFEPSSDPVLRYARTRSMNSNYLLHFDEADAGITPTQYQKDTFPKIFHDQISVVHEGIDTDAIAPNAHVQATFSCITGQYVYFKPGGSLPAVLRSFSSGDEILTFVNRNFEPSRGCHIFFRAIPELLKQRPNLQIIMAGADGRSYSAIRTENDAWRLQFWKEIEPQLTEDMRQRIHFVGTLNRQQFTQLLQLSTVHVYLTYPFVLSWSLMEAMSCECAIVSNRVQPVEELIEHDTHGLLIDFFKPKELVEKVAFLLDSPETRERLGKKARERIAQQYDLQRICLPQWLNWVEMLANSST